MPPIVPIPIITVNYIIEYKDSKICGQGLLPQAEVQVSIRTRSSALEVMEKAADIDPAYRFTVTYFTDKRGYITDAINGTTNNPAKNCSWDFVVGLPNGMQEYPDVSVSNYIIPGQGYTVLMWFQNAALRPNSSGVMVSIS